jgi:hypothetical protein
MDSVFEPGERITVTGTSQDVPEGATVTVDLGELTHTTKVRGDGSWSLSIYCPDEPGEYQLTASTEGASDYVYIQVEGDQGSSVMVLAGIIIAILAIIVIIIIVVFAMKKAEPAKQSQAGSEEPSLETPVESPGEETLDEEVEDLLEEFEKEDEILFEDTEQAAVEPEPGIGEAVEPSPETDDIPMGEPPPGEILDDVPGEESAEDYMFSLDDEDL